MAGITIYAPISSNNTTLFSDMKPHFSIFRTKKTAAVAYGFMFFFIAFTIFLAFTPSTNSSAPFFSNIFFGNISSHTQIFSDQSYRSHFSSIYYYFFPDPSQNTTFSLILNQAVNNQTNPIPKSLSSEVLKQNQTQSGKGHDKVEALKSNQSTIGFPKPEDNTVNNQTTPPPKSSPSGSLKQNQTKSDNVEVLKANQTSIGVPKSANNSVNNQTTPRPKSSPSESLKQNQTQSDKVEVLKANQTSIGVPNPANKTGSSTPKVIAEGGGFKNLTSSLMKKPNNGVSSEKGKQGIDDLVKSFMNCDFFDGNWVRDESYPLYKPGSCSLIDDQFKCILNGRPDNGYHKLRWKPNGCNLPRLDGSHMLEILRGKRLVFVGDSLNRNMWESLICILRNSVTDQKKVYEQSGKHHFKSDPSYSFVFQDYKLTVEFFVSPFLVREWETSGKDGSKKETLRLDLVGSSADKYKDADIIVFNTGHWWTHDKTSKGKDYYQEGSHVYSDLNVMEAFRKAITTWGRWVDANVNPKKSLVFFRGYSASHFSGGRWNSGGQCDHETEPIKNDTYLAEYPPKMKVVEKVMKGMKTDVTYLNVTRMTDYRKDGHPSIYRKQNSFDLSVQDCSHWCLPGVPDTWNEILYAKLLVKLNQKQQ